MHLRRQVDAQARAVAQQEAGMRVAWHVVRSLGQPVRVEGDHLVAGTVPLNRDGVVDTIQGLAGGNVTSFMGDRCIATTVAAANGSGRAVRTTLAKGPVYDAVLAGGKPFRGEADILGQPYFTACGPILDAEGHPIGIFSSACCRPPSSGARGAEAPLPVTAERRSVQASSKAA